MKIDYHYGDILNTDALYIAQCVNAQGKMNSGVAKAIRDRYPKVWQVYSDESAKGGLWMGRVIGANCGKHVILNIVGQDKYGYDGKLYLDYQALRRGIGSINRNVTQPVAFPLIGCGLAGGDWKLVSEIIEEEATNFQPIVYSLDDEVPF